MPTQTTGPQGLNVTYLFPFAGNRMSPAHGGGATGPIHILKTERPTNTETWCGLMVKTGRLAYGQKTSLPKKEAHRLHDACLSAYLAR